MNTEDCDLGSDEEIAGLDPEVEEPDSITKFLQLPTVSARTSTKKRDPVVDFAKSIILTSAANEEAARGVRDAREQAKQDKERQKEEREESRKRKAVEKSEAQARKLAVREERQREREARALEKAAAQEELNRQRETRAVEKAVAAARKVVQREAAARAKAERAQEVAMAKFLRASAERRNLSSTSSLRIQRVTESGDGRQTSAHGGHGVFGGSDHEEGPILQPQFDQNESQCEDYVPRTMQPPFRQVSSSHFMFPQTHPMFPAETIPAETNHERRPWLIEPTRQEENNFGCESRFRSAR